MSHHVARILTRYLYYVAVYRREIGSQVSACCTISCLDLWSASTVSKEEIIENLIPFCLFTSFCINQVCLVIVDPEVNHKFAETYRESN